MSNLKACLSTLTRLRIKGFGIAMDDYGTGYSSMKQLAKCPFTELKIDRSFVHAVTTDQKLLSILTAAINISQELELTSVAEGVEDFEDWRLARSLNCDIGQGYYFSRPLPKQEMLAYLIKRRE
ncbi:Oxygen sensor protein DosP [bioreactor metagenome]|uniref:Oxygen sensor protein DosP n=1 Tax=bioreactor metagenome TaxID=1076179 RepID=A0A645IHL3_9ZZZZ